jgi:aspartyl-tRNA(Asn)/glutamyl-tRNA(Gln) amidotransferase subunit C
MRKIDEETLDALLYLSRLSKESFSESATADPVETLRHQVDQIVSYFDILSEFDNSENPYDAYPTTKAENLRSDDVLKSLEISDIKKVSDEFLDGYFRVPKVLGEGV